MLRIRKGEITIFSALILSVMMALIVTCMTSARMAAARAQIAAGAEVGLFSAFGGYDRQLLEEYEIFGLNTGGSETACDLASFCHETERYMKDVFDENSQHLVLKKSGITGYRLLTDDDGEPFYQQAVCYEKDSVYGEEAVPRLSRLKDYAGYFNAWMETADAEEEKDWFTLYDAAIAEAERLSREADEGEEDLLTSGEDELYSGPAEGWEFSTIENPVPVMHSIHDSGFLSILLPEGNTALTGEAFDRFLSNRAILSGMEIYDGFTRDESSESGLFFQAYIEEKMGSYLDPGRGFLSCQREYILEGNGSDEENMEQIVSKLFRIRLGAALEYIDRNAACLDEIAALTERLCSLYTVPPVREIVSGTLRYSWAYGESLCELSALLSGGSVPLHGPDPLMVPLSGLILIAEYLENAGNGAGPAGDNPLEYTDYLSILLLGRLKKEKVMRTMDIVESTVRESGRPGFYLDHCLSSAEFAADVRVNGRKTFTVTKSYGYD